MRKVSLGNVLCGILLAAQGLAIVHAQSGLSRYFVWAPFDKQTLYSLDVTIPGRKEPLTAPEIRKRYHLRLYPHDNRSPQHVIDIVRQYEETYGRAEGARVVMRYTINGQHPGEWSWPPR